MPTVQLISQSLLSCILKTETGVLLRLHPRLGPLELDPLDGEELLRPDGLKVDVDALAPQGAFYLALVDG